jgi:hypothetical protein
VVSKKFSLAVAAGADVKAVQQMLGHASAAMTLDVYAGLFADDLEAVADRLDHPPRRTDIVRKVGALRMSDQSAAVFFLTNFEVVDRVLRTPFLC